jgi:REP element-mobilizing transposase RayT
VEFEGAVYHVMARGNERRDVFRDDADRRQFLEVLKEMVERFGVLVHVYCLMPNHYHLVLETPRGNLSQALGWLQLTYTIRFNRRWLRNGHLFQGRFKAQLVDAESYGRRLVRYVHLNPVRPKDKSELVAVERAQELDRYEWSSHQEFAGLRRHPKWLCLDWLGFWGRGRQGHAEYRAFVREAFGKEMTNPWIELRGGLVLGTERLWEKTRLIVEEKRGIEERRFVQGAIQSEARERVRMRVAHEPDARVRIWARVRLGGERGVDVARELGYKDGSAVTQLIKRLESAAAQAEDLRMKLASILSDVSSVKSRPPIHAEQNQLVSPIDFLD